MVNKAFLSLAAVVLFAVFGTGVFVGMQVGGLSGDAPGPAATDNGSTTSETAPQRSSPTATPDTASTPAPSEDDTETSSERETVPPREFNEQNISTAIAENINDAREEDGLSPLTTTGSTADNLRQMANGHSNSMADVGRVRHAINGVTSRDRYEREGLYQTCQFQVNSYVEKADNDALEVIGRTYAGQEYPDDGTQKFNGNDTAVANALTDDRLSTQLQRERLTYANAERVGVGVTVTNTGVVYATVNVCS